MSSALAPPWVANQPAIAHPPMEFADPQHVVLQQESLTPALQYQVRAPFAFTGHEVVDEALSTYHVRFIFPENRAPAETPVVFALQGLSAPAWWNGFVAETLRHLRIACVLLETPLAGDRSLARTHAANILSELQPIIAHVPKLDVGDLIARTFPAVSRDILGIDAMLREQLGYTDSRRALFGVSMGTLWGGYAFSHDAFGDRLLGSIGHLNLAKFARSYLRGRVDEYARMGWAAPAIPAAVRLLAPAGWMLRQLVGRPGQQLQLVSRAAMGVSRLADPEDACTIDVNPVRFAHLVDDGRRVRLLLGKDDHLVDRADAESSVEEFPDHEVYVVEGVGHGGPDFCQHIRYYLHTQLGDWSEW